MKKDLTDRWNVSEFFLSLSVLFILLFFTYGIFGYAPYIGFRFNPPDGKILAVYIQGKNEPTLKEGDVLVRVGANSLDDYHADNRLAFFKGIKPGDTINVVVNRNGTELAIPWVIPGFNQLEFNIRFFNIWWLAYIFWVVGFAAQLLLRPKNSTLRRLFIAAFYLMGLWLIFGSISAWHLLEGSILMHVAAWLLLPVYLHLHWVFPKPLRLPQKWLGYFFYAVCLLLAIAELFQIPPRGFYALGFLLAMAGSAVLLGVHFFRQPDQRRDLALVLTATLLVVIPLISFSISDIASKIAPLAFLALPLMPLAYFYTIYRRQLGGMELRANRLISVYSFLILIGAALPLLIRPITLIDTTLENMILLIIGITVLIVIASIQIFPSFQSFLEQHLLGIKLPYQNLQESFSSRIAASTSINDLLLLLENDVFPSLFIRQFAFMQTSNGSLKALLAKNVSAEEMPDEGRISQLVERSGKFIPALSSDDEWIRLILPLKAGDSFIGFWLLGRRDPDDYYPQAEIPILQSIANQTAIALSYVLQAEHLKSIYQDGISQYEDERMRLALLLHDSILNELAALRMNLDEAEVTPAFQKAYQKLTSQVREIIFNLRPPMLEYGLKPALEEMAGTLTERNQGKIEIIVKIETDDSRYQIRNMEEHIFRMVQEACENAVRHAQAKIVQITGRLLEDEISLSVEDNGNGFETKDGLGIDTLVKQKHFGLAGILKRAQLIGAEASIHSNLGIGTHIQVTWKPTPL